MEKVGIEKLTEAVEQLNKLGIVEAIATIDAQGDALGYVALRTAFLDAKIPKDRMNELKGFIGDTFNTLVDEEIEEKKAVLAPEKKKATSKEKKVVVKTKGITTLQQIKDLVAARKDASMTSFIDGLLLEGGTVEEISAKAKEEGTKRGHTAFNDPRAITSHIKNRRDRDGWNVMDTDGKIQIGEFLPKTE